MAHEINTPLQYIGDNMHFLREPWSGLKPALVLLLEAPKRLRAETDPTMLADELGAAIAKQDIEYLIDQFPCAIEQSWDGVKRVTRIARAMQNFSPRCSCEGVFSALTFAVDSVRTRALSSKPKHIPKIGA